jgi:uncharacterized delta-60 repeat protein
MSASTSRSRPFLRPALGLACLLAASLLIGASGSRASAAGLDPAFGHGGRLTVSSVDPDEWIYGLHTAALPGGGLVLAGEDELVELTPEGQLDDAFGTAGVVAVPKLDGLHLEFEGLVVDGEGRIYVFGAAAETGNDDYPPGLGPRYISPDQTPSQAAVLRFLPDGELDPSFADDGFLHSDFGIPAVAGSSSHFVRARVGTLDALGRPLLALTSYVPVASCLHGEVESRREDVLNVATRRLVRLTTAGETDPSFAATPLAAPPRRGTRPLALALGPDGAPVLSATTTGACPAQTEDLLLRSEPEGGPDARFGSEGVRAYPTLPYPKAVATEPDGDTLILGPAKIWRLTPGGRVDPSFGEGGVAHLSLGSPRGGFRALALDAEGRIYAVGTEFGRRVGGQRRSTITVARLGPGGTPDRTFGHDGLARARFHGHSAVAAGAVSAGSTLVVAGVEHKLGEPFVDQDGRLIFAGFAESAVSATAVDRGDLSCGGPAGTVRSIGEGVIGTPISDFVSCFGPPVRERRGPEGRCLFYRDGEARRTFWEFCVRKGRIVSASGNHHHPR